MSEVVTLEELILLRNKELDLAAKLHDARVRVMELEAAWTRALNEVGLLQMKFNRQQQEAGK